MRISPLWKICCVSTHANTKIGARRERKAWGFRLFEFVLIFHFRIWDGFFFRICVELCKIQSAVHYAQNVITHTIQCTQYNVCNFYFMLFICIHHTPITTIIYHSWLCNYIVYCHFMQTMMRCKARLHVFWHRVNTHRANLRRLQWKSPLLRNPVIHSCATLSLIWKTKSLQTEWHCKYLTSTHWHGNPGAFSWRCHFPTKAPSCLQPAWGFPLTRSCWTGCVDIDRVNLFQVFKDRLKMCQRTLREKKE